MLNLVIVIRGEVDDETEAKRILGYIEDCLETNEDDVLNATCKTTQEITNG